MVASAANEAIAPPGMPGGAHGQDHICQQDHNHHGGTDLNAAGVGENTIMNDNTMETASMLTVAPRGIAILVILSDTPISSSMHRLLRGDGGRTGTGAKGVQSCRQSA